MHKQLKNIVLAIAVFMTYGVNAQPMNMTAEEYIDTYYSIAVREMLRSGIPASITLAQGLYESGWGNSRLAREANNHFGIKCHKEWSGPSITHDDDALGECFRKYQNAEESYIDHSNFLMTRERYKFLFNYPANDYVNWASGLKLAGYATNPRYSQELVTRIEKYQLYRFDDVNYVHVPTTGKPVVPPPAYDPIAVKEAPKTVVENKSNVTPTVPKKTITTYNNGLLATKSFKDETVAQMAARMGLSVELVCRYNECKPDQVLPEGTFMYYVQKGTRNKLVETYTVKPGENMWLISQRYGVKEAMLRKRNKLDKHEEPVAKQTVYLNKTTPNKPIVLTQPAGSPVYTAQAYPVQQPQSVTEKVAREEVVAAKPSTQPVNNYENPTVIVLDSKANVPVASAPAPKAPETPKPAAPVQKQVEQPAVSQPVSKAPEYQVMELPAEKPIQTAKPVQQAAAAKPAGTVKTHVAEPKQTLYGISKMYGTSIEQLMEWNGLTDYNIKIGSTLIVGK